MIHSYQRLREQCLAAATRPFQARGGSIKRCARCQLGLTTCICPWRVEMNLDVDVILLMHRDEVFKPTNTGRLIADLFPQNTYSYLWSRTEPSAALLDHLGSAHCFPVIVFPPDESHSGDKNHGDDENHSRMVYAQAPALKSDQRLTLVLLDGTWKQARKMFKTSRYLHGLPLMILAESRAGRYAVRQAHLPGQLSTAEATAALLQQCGELAGASLLEDYFAVFNQHYVSSRRSTPPLHSEHHHRLEQALQNLTVPAELPR